MVPNGEALDGPAVKTPVQIQKQSFGPTFLCEFLEIRPARCWRRLCALARFSLPAGKVSFGRMQSGRCRPYSEGGHYDRRRHRSGSRACRTLPAARVSGDILRCWLDQRRSGHSRRAGAARLRQGGEFRHRRLTAVGAGRTAAAREPDAPARHGRPATRGSG